MIDLKSLISSQVPEFVSEDYPAFIQFVKAYYEWLGQQDVGRLSDLTDIDKTIESFLIHFKHQLDVNGTNYSFVDQRLFLKNIKSFYSAKGSEESYKFILRVLLGKEAEMQYPWDYVLIPSEGKWYQDISIIVKINTGVGADLSGQHIYIKDSTGYEHRAFVQSSGSFMEGTYEIFVDRIYNDASISFGNTFRTIDSSITGELLATTAKVQVDYAGTGFQAGELYEIVSHAGSGTIIKVKEVTATGGIVAAQIIQFGIGYDVSFTATIYPISVINPNRTSNITLNRSGGSPFVGNYPTYDKLNNSLERFLVVKHDYTEHPGDNDEYFADNTYVGKVKGDHTSQNVLKAGPAADPAILRFTLGAFCKYPGYYLTGQSILDDLCYIQDSYYYQKFSYVTIIEEKFETYADILRKVIHPVGTVGFGKYLINNEFSLSLQLYTAIGLLIKPYFDTASVSDTVTKEVNKYLSDNADALQTDGAAWGDIYVEEPYNVYELGYKEKEHPFDDNV